MLVSTGVQACIVLHDNRRWQNYKQAKLEDTLAVQALDEKRVPGRHAATRPGAPTHSHAHGALHPGALGECLACWVHHCQARVPKSCQISHTCAHSKHSIAECLDHWYQMHLSRRERSGCAATECTVWRWVMFWITTEPPGKESVFSQRLDCCVYPLSSAPEPAGAQPRSQERRWRRNRQPDRRFRAWRTRTKRVPCAAPERRPGPGPSAPPPPPALHRVIGCHTLCFLHT